MYQGACCVSVFLSMMSRAREYSYQRLREGRSIGLSFHWRSGSVTRASNRRFCSSLPTSSQSLIRMMPPVDDELLDLGAQLQKALVLLVRAEAHHVFDARAVVPAPIEDDRPRPRRESAACSAACTSAIFSRSEGAGRATTLKTRGLSRSVIARIVPPFPAPSRPSKMTMTRRPFSLTQRWRWHSRTCSLFSALLVLRPFHHSSPQAHPPSKAGIGVRRPGADFLDVIETARLRHEIELHAGLAAPTPRRRAAT